MPTNEYLKQMRSDFSKQSLSKKDVDSNPFTQFKNWLQQLLQIVLLGLYQMY
jgi:pyridoxine/pyridoxamine 5'-phosphate oxidase